jgi:hypothetical protein
VQTRKGDETESDLQAAAEAGKESATKDDNDLGAGDEYAHNNFWRRPDAFDIEDLLKEALLE